MQRDSQKFSIASPNTVYAVKALPLNKCSASPRTSHTPIPLYKIQNPPLKKKDKKNKIIAGYGGKK